MKVIINIANNIEKYICIVILTVMLGILTWQVLMRAIGNSNSWSEEVARYLFIWLVYVGGSMAAQRNAHIVIEILPKIWPKAIRRYIVIMGTIIWIVFSVFIIYYSGKYAIMLWIAKRISLGLLISMAIPHASVTVGYVFMVIRIIQCQLIPQIRDPNWSLRGGETQ